MSVDTDDRTLYVANLHKNVTEELLYELFLQAGPVERVSIPNVGSQNFQYGFVTYIHHCSIDYALQLYKGTCLFKKKLLIRRKGERGNDRQTVSSDRYSGEGINNQEKVQDNPIDLEYSYLPQYLQSNDNYNSGKTLNQISNLTQNSHKGQWSNRYRPYEHDSRRHYNSRPVNNNNRDRHRNHSNANYNKSHRERKGRY